MHDFPADPRWLTEHIDRLARSHLRWTGRALFPGVAPADWARVAWESPAILVSHGTQADPILNFGNRTALAQWDMSWDDFTRTPSRLTAEAPERDERARLMAQVTSQGFIANYAGIRVSRTGRRFRIHAATVWNILDSNELPAGQAATFDRWDWL